MSVQQKHIGYYNEILYKPTKTVYYIGKYDFK